MTEPPTVRFPGVEIELSRVLHASESVTVPAPLPPSGSARAVTRITGVWDKGKAAVIDNETSDPHPTVPAVGPRRASIFARGEGGFGGERGPSASVAPPDRAPDLVVDIPTPCAGAALPDVRRSQSAALRSRIRRRGRLPAADPARAVYLRDDL